MADVGAPHVTRVTLFRNGDPNFNGKHIVVNPRYYRNFESFLDTATFSTQCTSAVTRICTPLGRHTIDSVDQLANGGMYVAVGRESFKRLKYGQPKPRRAPIRLPPVWRNANHLPSSGRFRKVYEGERQALKRIYVFRNGDHLTPARMILLKRRMLTDMELVLVALQESGLDFDFAISKLFTLDGKQIHDCHEIVHDGKYVAIERGSRFKFMNYGGQGGVSPRNVVSHPVRLPPIGAPQNNNHVSVNRSPKKNIKPTIDKPKPPAKQEVKNGPSSQTQLSKRTKRAVIPNQQSIISISQEENRDSFSNVNLSASPPPLDESPDFTLSAAIKAQESETNYQKLPELGNIPSDIHELPEKERESIGAQIYKASGMQREWGEMVTDPRDIPEKQPIVEESVEEIVEDITEDIEGVTEIAERPKDDVGKDSSKEMESEKRSEKEEDKVIELVEEVKEVAEVSIEDDQKDGIENKEKRSDSKASKNKVDHSDEEPVEEETDEESEGELGSTVDDDDNDCDDDDDDKINENEGKADEDERPVSPAADKNDDNPDDVEKLNSDKNLSAASPGNDDKKVDSGKTPAISVDEDKNDDDDDDNDDDNDDDKDNSPAASPDQSRASSQEMDSEDEVKSEDEVDEEEEEEKDDDDDDDDDDKSEENEESEEEKDDSEDDDEDEDQEDEDDKDESVASEPEEASASEKEDESETEEIAMKENKTNRKVEKKRAQPDTSALKKEKPNIGKGRSTKTRDVNKA